MLNVTNFLCISYQNFFFGEMQQEQNDAYLPAEMGIMSKQPTNYFCHWLWATPACMAGSLCPVVLPSMFSPHRCDECVFWGCSFCLAAWIVWFAVANNRCIVWFVGFHTAASSIGVYCTGYSWCRVEVQAYLPRQVHHNPQTSLFELLFFFFFFWKSWFDMLSVVIHFIFRLITKTYSQDIT
jgi:hypothetical protein